MSILSAFRKPAAPAASPARAAFNAQRREYLAKDRQRQALHAQAAGTQSMKADADAAAAKVSALRAAIDESIALVLADGAAQDLDARKRDLEARRSELAAAEAEAERLAPIGRVAEIAHRRVTSQVATLTNEMQALYVPIPRLLHAALLEQLEQTAEAFREAELAFRAQHHATFVLAVAADMLAKAHQFGVFVRSGGHADLFISRPELPGFQHWPSDPWQSKLARDAEARSFDDDATKLISAMLNSDGVG